MVARGGVQEQLCLACAEARTGITGLSGLIRATVGNPAPASSCPYCGRTVEEARRTGLAGCPLCYSALGDVWRDLGAPPGRYAGGQ